MSGNASGAYEAIRGVITQAEHLYALETKRATESETLLERISTYQKHYLTIAQREQLGALGIATIPHADAVHPHAGAKTLENYVLTQIIPHLLKEDFTAMWIKEEKLARLLTTEQDSAQVINTIVDVKDVFRYPNGSFGLPSPITTPLGFIHDAGHYMTKADVASLFHRSQDMHTLIVTMVHPVESDLGLPSQSPALYTYKVREDGTLTWFPDGHTDGQYHQHTRATWWYHTSALYGDGNMTLKIKLHTYIGGHHVYVVTRLPCLPETRVSFNMPSLTLLPGAVGRVGAETLINREFVIGMVSFVFRGTTIGDAILQTKADCLARDIVRSKIDVREKLKAVSLCMDVARLNTMGTGGFRLLSGLAAPLQRTTLGKILHTALVYPWALAANDIQNQFAFEPYCHDVELKPHYMHRLDVLSYAFGGFAEESASPAHIRAMLLAIAAGAPQEFEQLVQETAGWGATPRMVDEDILAQKIADLIIALTWSAVGISLALRAPQIAYRLAKWIVPKVLGARSPLHVMAILFKLTAGTYALTKLGDLAAAELLQSFGQALRRAIAKPVDYLIKEIIIARGPEWLKELEFKMRISLICGYVLEHDPQHPVRARVIAWASEKKRGNEGEVATTQDEAILDEDGDLPMRDVEPIPIDDSEAVAAAVVEPSEQTGVELMEAMGNNPTPEPTASFDGTILPARPLRYTTIMGVMDIALVDKDVVGCSHAPWLKGNKPHGACAINSLEKAGVCTQCWREALPVRKARHPTTGALRAFNDGWFDDSEIAAVLSSRNLPPPLFINGHTAGAIDLLVEQYTALEFTGLARSGHWEFFGFVRVTALNPNAAVGEAEPMTNNGALVGGAAATQIQASRTIPRPASFADALVEAVDGVVRTFYTCAKRLDVAADMMEKGVGYREITQDAGTVRAVRALADQARLKNGRRVKISGIMGLPGTGKTYALKQIAARHYANCGPNNKITWICPTDELRKAAKEDLKPPIGCGRFVKTFEVAIFHTVTPVVVVDELGLYPPGWLDVLVQKNPMIQWVIYTGDTCQPRWRPKQGPANRYGQSNLDVVAGHACRYLFNGNRLHVDTARHLGLPAGPHAPSTPGQGGVMFSSQIKEDNIVGSNAMETAYNEKGSNANNFNGCQGLTYDGNWSVMLSEQSACCDNYVAFVALTRGRGTLSFDTGDSSGNKIDRTLKRHTATIFRNARDPIALRGAVAAHVNRNVPNELRDPTRRPKPAPATVLLALKKQIRGRVGGAEYIIRYGPKPITRRSRLADRFARLVSLVREGLVNIRDFTAGAFQVLDQALFNGMLTRLVHLAHIYSPSLPNMRPEPSHHLHERKAKQDRGPGVGALITPPCTRPQRGLMTKAEAHLDAELRFPEEGDKERQFEGKWTRQKQDLSVALPIFNRHHPSDEATAKWTAKERFVKKREFMKGYATTGAILFHNLKEFMGLGEPEPFDEMLYEDCVAEDRRRFLEKGEKRLYGIKDKADADWDDLRMDAFLKNQFVTKPGQINAPAKKGQLILEFSTAHNQRMGPLAKYLQKKFLDALPANVYVHAFGSEDDLGSFVAQHMDFTKISLEGDYTAFDASEDEVFRECVVLLMRHFHIPEDKIQHYIYTEENFFCYLGKAAVSMKSGSKFTYIVNCIVNLAYLVTRFDIPKGTAIAISGDDSVVNHPAKQRASWNMLAARFRLDLKEIWSEFPTFCGWKLTPGGVFKDPTILYARTLHQAYRDNLAISAASYACDIQHLHNNYDRLSQYVTSLEADDHARTLSILQAALKATGQQYVGKALHDGKVERRYRLASNPGFNIHLNTRIQEINDVADEDEHTDRAKWQRGPGGMAGGQ